MTETTASKAADEAWQAQRRRLQPYHLRELENLPKREQLVKGILDRGGMSVMYGDSNSGKTFIALDLGLHIAIGREWSGQRIQQGVVLYIAAEGGFGITKRLHAFLKHHALTKELPFHFVPAAVDFCSGEKDAQEVVSEAARLGRVDLVVIDTLSRALSGGNENSPDDMGKFIKYCDLIRQGTGAHVMIIHHTGKDGTRGARGHSSLRAATDTEIEVVQPEKGIVTAEITKQRDGRTGDTFSFTLEVIDLDNDEDGDPVTSCILTPTEQPTTSSGALRPSKVQGRALSILHDVLLEKGEKGIPKKDMSMTQFVKVSDFRAALTKGNISSSDKPDSVRRQIDRVIDDLNNKGFTATWEDKIWQVGRPGQ